MFVMESKIMKDSSTSNGVEVGDIHELLEKDRFVDNKETATSINIQWIASEHIVEIMSKERGSTTIDKSYGH